MIKIAVALAFSLLALAAVAQSSTSHIGGAQTSNTRVSDAPPANSTTDASGAAHVVIRQHAAAKAGSKAGGTPKAASTHNSSSKPRNDVLPTDPASVVELWPIAFRRLILHREPCVMDPVRDAFHTRGPVVVDVELDQDGNIDGLDYIGAPDLGEACMRAVRGWKFAPFQYQGQPWRVKSWIRFEFATPQQRSATEAPMSHY